MSGRFSGYVAEKADKVVGCIVWEKQEDNTVHLLALGKVELESYVEIIITLIRSVGSAQRKWHCLQVVRDLSTGITQNCPVRSDQQYHSRQFLLKKEI